MDVYDTNVICLLFLAILVISCSPSQGFSLIISCSYSAIEEFLIMRHTHVVDGVNIIMRYNLISFTIMHIIELNCLLDERQ